MFGLARAPLSSHGQPRAAASHLACLSPPDIALASHTVYFRCPQVLHVIANTRMMPPLALVVLTLSKRLHSIYLLRLFNDCVAMLPMHMAILGAQRGKWELAAVLWSLSVSVKMNALLFAPALVVLMLRAAPLTRCVLCAALAVAVQVVLAIPFLGHPQAYFGRAFEFGREFKFKWSVNWQFLPEEARDGLSLAMEAAAPLCPAALCMQGAQPGVPPPPSLFLACESESSALILPRCFRLRQSQPIVPFEQIFLGDELKFALIGWHLVVLCRAPRTHPRTHPPCMFGPSTRHRTTIPASQYHSPSTA